MTGPAPWPRTAPAGDISFRVGVPLKLDKNQPDQVFWSEPVKITVQTPVSKSASGPPPAEKAAATAKKPWTIEATPNVTTVQPGGKLDFTVRIINTVEANAKLFVRTKGVWYAKSDNPNIAFPAPPNGPHSQPMIVIDQVTLAPKEAYTHDWSCTVASDAPAGEITFRVGVPVPVDKSQPDQILWSELVKITVQPQTSK